MTKCQVFNKIQLLGVKINVFEMYVWIVVVTDKDVDTG